MSRIINTEELIRNAPFELSKADKEALTTTEEDFVPHIWEDIQRIIVSAEIQATFGSVTNFLVKTRLHWGKEANNAEIRFPYRHSVPFADQSDYRILRNDWPYAMSSDMVHLVAWLKMPIPVDAEGDPTTKSRRLVADFTDRTFAMHMTREHTGNNIQWFKNRIKWQSVRALEHIHVILRDLDDEFVTKLTGQGPDDIECKWYSISVNGN
ncbi:hypothetical protein RU639_013333 [Aspergillus parasiticus]